MADRLLRVLLEIVPKTTGAFQKALGIGGGSGAGAATSPQASQNLQKITSGFSDMHKQIALLNTAIRPDLIAKQAALEVKLAKATADYDKALGAAKGGGGGFSMFGMSGLGMAGAAAGVVAGGIASVAARSPATMERFERALLDVTAVVGETFGPVLDIITENVRLFGDVLASILPDAGEMKEILAPLMDSFKEMREALAPITPIIKESLVTVLKVLVGAIELVNKALVFMAQAVSKPIEAMVHRDRMAMYDTVAAKVAAGTANKEEKWMTRAGRAAFEAQSLKLSGFSALTSSTGMAATSASYIGGEERGKAAYAAAFAQGRVNASQQTADNTKELVTIAREQLNELRRKAGENPDLDAAKEGR